MAGMTMVCLPESCGDVWHEQLPETWSDRHPMGLSTNNTKTILQ